MLPAPTAPSEGSAGLKDTFRRTRHPSPGSPAQASLPIKPLPRERSLDFLLDRAARKLARLSIIAPDPKVKAIRCSAALLGSIALASRFALSPRKGSEPRRARGRSTLPAPLPDWPRETPRSSSLPVGGDRSFRHPPLSFLPLPAFRWRRGLPSRSPGYNAHAFRVAEAKNAVKRLWITGISGTTVGTIVTNANRDSAGSQFVPVTSQDSARTSASRRAGPSSRFARPSGSALEARSRQDHRASRSGRRSGPGRPPRWYRTG